MKTEEDIKLDNLFDEYFDKFGENYPLVITSLISTDEIIADIEDCIKKGKSKAKPKYDRKAVY